MENLVLAVDNGYALDEKYNNFEMAQKEFLLHNLSLERVSSMQEALLTLSKQDYLLVIIVEDSVNFLPQLPIMRNMKPMPIIILSTVYEEETGIEALNIGADAYIHEPTTLKGFYAFCNAMIRRYKEFNNREEVKINIIAHKSYTMFPEQRKLFINEQEISLTRKEFDVLYLFLK